MARKKKNKARNKKNKGTYNIAEDSEEAPAPIIVDEPLDDEGLRKKAAVLEALQ